MTIDGATAGKGPSRGAIYGMATRAYSFPASIVSVLLGTALAARGYGAVSGRFSILAFVLTLTGALLAHAGGNVLNDYYDYRKGVDTLPEHGSGVLPQGLLSAGQMFRFGWALLAGAGLVGLVLLAMAPSIVTAIVPLAMLGLACAVLYTSVLKRYALGDAVIMVAFGLGLPLGSYAVQQPLHGGAQVGLILLLSIPLTLLVDAILHANNRRDVATDTAKGVHTLASLLGERGSGLLHLVLVFGPPAAAAVFVALRLIPWTALLAVLPLPLLLKAYRSGDVPFTAQADLVFGVLYALGIILLPRP
jgi:1,4-dihydroxy-2-naphthoate octaprenyltransferase